MRSGFGTKSSGLQNLSPSETRKQTGRPDHWTTPPDRNFGRTPVEVWRPRRACLAATSVGRWDPHYPMNCCGGSNGARRPSKTLRPHHRSNSRVSSIASSGPCSDSLDSADGIVYRAETCCRVIGRQLSRRTRAMRSQGLFILDARKACASLATAERIRPGENPANPSISPGRPPGLIRHRHRGRTSTP